MSSLLLCSAYLVTLAAAWPTYLPEHAEMHFNNFIETYGKQYPNEQEKQARFEIFKDNLEISNRMNEESDHAEFGITPFMDLTSEEFVNTYAGCTSDFNVTGMGCGDIADNQITYNDAPESFDWREHNAVTTVKNQGKCGGCYTFSATGNIEGVYAIKHGQLMDLSKQQIIDCDKYSHGCQGGYMTSAFRQATYGIWFRDTGSYVIKSPDLQPGLSVLCNAHLVNQTLIQQGGIMLAQDYPYVARQQQCRFVPGKAAIRLTECYSLNVVSQEKLKQYLFHNGPISIGVRAESFQTYRGGIHSDVQCRGGQINHAVLLVGYGNENGSPYWIVKNSWGVSWGESGYIRLQRGERAESCGMMNNRLMATSVVM